MNNKALVILGPTASGKTALGIKLKQHFDLEIISLDSALVYRQMDIGTAKPSAEELAQVKHHLIDIIDPKDSYSAADFRADCIKLVNDIQQQGKVPVILGGTMLYYKALVDGLSPVPKTEDWVREKIYNEAQIHGWPYMHEKLKDIDPISYEKLHPQDKQRVSRALEVYEQTGRAITSYYENKGEQCPFERKEIVLYPEDDRQKLRVMIRQRFIKMIEDGFIDEVKRLKNRGDLNLNMPSMRCVGYRQVWEYLDGMYDYDEMIERGVIATAHLAKHQMTWLRGGLSTSIDLKDRLVIKPDDSNLEQKVLEFLSKL